MKRTAKFALLACLILLASVFMFTACGGKDNPTDNHPSVDEQGTPSGGNQSTPNEDEGTTPGDGDQTTPGDGEENKPLTTSSVGLAYKVNSDGKTCKITGIGTCTDTDLIIGTHIEGYEITEIDSSAFDYCRNLTSVTVLGNVEKIGRGAFSSCVGLTSITLPFVGYSKEIRETYANSHFGYIFGAWNYDENEYYVPKSLKTVVILDGAEGIGDYAFWNCESITSITIPDSVVEIKRSAFSGCSESIYQLQDGVYYVGKWAAGATNDVEHITLREGTIGIAGSAFSNMDNLTSIVIPDSVVCIGDSAFFFSDILSIEFRADSRLSIIGEYAFNGCSNLESISLSESLTRIGDRAFQGCTLLTSITFEGSIQEWNAVELSYMWKSGSNITQVVCSDGSTV